MSSLPYFPNRSVCFLRRVFMRRLFILIIIFVLSPARGISQPKLRHSIGLTSLPKNTDSVCAITPYYRTFDLDGLNPGDTAYDLTLFDIEGNPFTLSAILRQKKPVLLISGSYTCPMLRFRVPAINYVVKDYGSRINTYLIYTYEA